MKAGTIAATAGALMLGIVIGAGSMYVYARHRFVSTIEHLAAALATPTAAAPAASVGALSSAGIDKTEWKLSSNTDAISGRTTWFVAGISREQDTVLYVRCGIAPGALDTFVYGERLYPDADDAYGGGEYFVSYRFDQKPGVSLQHWDGSTHSASPYAKERNTFLGAMEHSKSLIMRIGSTVMDSSGSGSQDQHFDLAGYNAARAQLLPHCTGIKAQTARP